MSRQNINVGTTANDGTGDTLRQALTKCNENFAELYSSNKLGVFDVSSLPDSDASAIGNLIYVSDGDSGEPCLSVYDGTNWKIISLGSSI